MELLIPSLITAAFTIISGVFLYLITDQFKKADKLKEAEAKAVKALKEEQDKRMQLEMLEQAVIKQGLLALLHDRLYESCQFYINQGWLSAQDLKSLTYLYEAYHKLGGNGTGTALYKRCCGLLLKANKE